MRNRRENLTKIKEILEPTTDLFSYIGYDLTGTTLTTQMLSFLFYSRCANKWCSPFIENLIEEDDDGEKEISVQKFQMLGSYIKGILQPNWDKFKAITLEEYDPIHNFSNITVETISDEKSNTRTDDLTRTDNTTRTDSFTNTNVRVEEIDTTEQVDKSDNSSGESGIYGFNSDDSVGSNTDTNELSSSITTDKDGSITTTDNGSNGGTSSNTGTVKNTGTQSDSGTFERERETTQTGNIGNLSTQKLLTEEIELWQWNFAEQMVTDVMRLLTLSIY